MTVLRVLRNCKYCCNIEFRLAPRVSQQKMSTSKEAAIHRESLAKEFKAKELWEKKYGKKYRREITVDSSRKQELSVTRPFRDHRTQNSDSEEEYSDDEDIVASDEPVPMTGLTSRFVGFYVPDKSSKRTFNTTTKETELLKTAKHVAKDSPKQDFSNHRKKDWMKNYFEEYSKQKKANGGSKTEAK